MRASAKEKAMQLTKAQKNVIALAENGTAIMESNHHRPARNDGGDREVILVPRLTVDALIRRGMLKPRDRGIHELETTDKAKAAYDRSRKVWFIELGDRA